MLAMATGWSSVHGVLVKGYGVASGPSADYPYGALERQIPIFKTRGLDLSGYFRGTLNIDIRPSVLALINPEFTFENVEWTDLHPPETFSFVKCKLVYAADTYPGRIYYPHPETKIRHFQNPSLVEVIAWEILGIRHGDQLELLAEAARIEFVGPE